MRYFHKTFSIFLSLLSVGFLLCACGKETPPQDTETSVAKSEEPSSSEPFAFRSFTVAGTQIADYQLVYAASPYDSLSRRYTKYISYEMQFDLRTAERVSDLIYDRFGVRLTPVKDTEAEAKEHEILIGKTNRRETSGFSSLGTDEFRVLVKNGKLILCGGAFGTTWHAVDTLEALFDRAREAQTPDVRFAETEDLSGTYHLRSVACIGDSITNGSESTEPLYFSYPANLQRLLWKDYVVFNYGHGSRTMRDDITEWSYMGTSPKYTECLANKSHYDIVLVMLGTNDSYRDEGEWTGADDKSFLSSANRLFESLKTHSPNAQFVLMNCPFYYKTGKFSNPHTRELQLQAAKNLAGNGYAIRLYDMCSFSAKEMGESLFADGLHPNDAGYAKMAEGVSHLIFSALDGEKNEYWIDLNN